MVVLGSEWPRNCWMTRSGASFTAMLVPTVWRMEWGLMGLVIPAARTYFFTMFWTERVVRGLSLPTRDVRRGVRASVGGFGEGAWGGWVVGGLSLPTRDVRRGLRASVWEFRERPVRRTYRWTRRQRSGEIGTLRILSPLPSTRSMTAPFPESWKSESLRPTTSASRRPHPAITASRT